MENGNTIDEHRSIIVINIVFDCHLSPDERQMASPDWRQMAIEITVSSELLCGFVNC